MTPDLARKLRVGFLVNPLAGLGGRAALKGSDDVERIAPLLATHEWGEETHAFARGASAVRRLDRNRVVLVTPPGVLGEDVVKAATKFGGPVFEIVRVPGWAKDFGHTTAADTMLFARRLVSARIDLLLFVGGDGTALDVSLAVGPAFPILGVPGGVKMFSPVFAETPETAALVVNLLREGFAHRSVDVLDLDERSYREGAWVVRSHAVASLPEAEGIQAGKGGPLSSEPEALEDLVTWFRGHERAGVAYLLGSGSTLGAIKAALGGGTPLGIDMRRDGRWVVEDADEAQLVEALGDDGPAEIVVSPTGLQGAVLGRGTAQLSPPVIERVGPENVVVVATPSKLLGMGSLFVDTGDPELDRAFPDYVKVRTDPLTEKVFPLRRGPAPPTAVDAHGARF